MKLFRKSKQICYITLPKTKKKGGNVTPIIPLLILHYFGKYSSTTNKDMPTRMLLKLNENIS